MYLNLPITADNTPRAQFAKNDTQNVWKSSTCTAGKLTVHVSFNPQQWILTLTSTKGKTRVLFLSNMPPSQIPVQKKYTFCKKNNGVVNNSAIFPFLHLNKSLPLLWRSFYWTLSFQGYTSQREYSKPVFLFAKRIWKKTKTHNKNPTILPLWLVTQQAEPHVRGASFQTANPVVSFPSFSVIPQTHPAPLLQHVHVTYLQLHLKIPLFAIKLNVLSEEQTLFLK